MHSEATAGMVEQTSSRRSERFKWKLLLERLELSRE